MRELTSFNGHYFKVFDSYGLSQCEFRSGSFSEDARGRWYFKGGGLAALVFESKDSEGSPSL